MTNGRLPASDLAPIAQGRLRKDAAAAWNAMNVEARRLGCELLPTGSKSSYRSYDQQVELWNLYKSGRGNLAATPGTSNHGLGLAVDLATHEMRSMVDRIGARWGYEKRTSDAQCVPLDTRILTRRGFLAYDELRPGDETVGYDVSTGRSAWTPILGIRLFDDAPLLAYEHSTLSLRCTPEHRWIVGPRAGGAGTPMTIRSALAGDSQRRVILAASGAEGLGLPITDQEAALLGWAMTDGSIRRFENSRGRRAFARIYQRKPVGVSAVGALMAHFEHRYDPQYRTSTGGPTHMWYVGRRVFSEVLHRSGLDDFGPVRMVLAMTSSQRKAWLDAVRMAEGDQPRMVNIAQSESENREAIAVAGALEGHFVTLRARTVDLRREAVRCNTLSERNLGHADVWCPTTGLGTWTAEQDGQVFITGNSEWWHIKWREGSWHGPDPGPGGQGAPAPAQAPIPKLPEDAVAIAVGTMKDGRLEVFVEDKNGQVWHAYNAKEGGWAKDDKGKAWFSLGTPGK